MTFRYNFKMTRIPAVCFLFVAVFFFSTAAFPSQEGSFNYSRKSNKKALRVNRLLLTQYETASERLKNELRLDEADNIQRGRKIMALEKLERMACLLENERSRLLEKLPEKIKTHEFLDDVLIKQKIKKELALDTLAADADSPISAKVSPSSRLYKLVDKADALISQNNYREAIKIYEKIILIEPDDETWMMLGHLYLSIGRFEESEKAFYNAIQLYPENLVKIKRFYENIVLENPSSDNAYTSLGYVYLMIEDYVKANRIFQEALQINPDNLLAKNGFQLSLHSSA